MRQLHPQKKTRKKCEFLFLERYSFLFLPQGEKTYSAVLNTKMNIENGMYIFVHAMNVGHRRFQTGVSPFLSEFDECRFLHSSFVSFSSLAVSCDFDFSFCAFFGGARGFGLDFRMLL